MRRGVALATLMMVGALSLAVRAYQQPPARGPVAPQAKVVDVEKLRDNLFMLKGGGGNTAVFVATNGVVVVDTKLDVPDRSRVRYSRPTVKRFETARSTPRP